MKRAVETTGTVDDQGRLHLDAPPPPLEAGRVRVLLLFEDAAAAERVDLRARGIGAEEAAALRGRLLPFADEWESQEMSIYDDYDAARS